MRNFQILICVFVALGVKVVEGYGGNTGGMGQNQDPYKIPNETWYKLFQNGKFDNQGRGFIGGYKNFLCTANKNNITFGECSRDCYTNHGATYGVCGSTVVGDYNCYCGEPVEKVEEASLHCSERTQEYVDTCTQDCLCNHAATGGICNFNDKACACTGQGKNIKNVGCKYPTWHAFSAFVHRQVGHRGYAFVDKPYHWFVAGDVEYPTVPQF